VTDVNLNYIAAAAENVRQTTLPGAGPGRRGRAPVLVEPAGLVEWVLPVELPSLPNLRGHWAKRDKLRTAQFEAIHAGMRDLHVPSWGAAVTLPFPRLVTFTRLGGRKLDADNLAACFKFVQDCIVGRYLGLDDGDDRLTFDYRQEASKMRGLRVRIETRR
jgi:hypothetical protein